MVEVELSSRIKVGPVFFEGTVTGKDYLQILQQKIIQHLENNFFL